MSNLKSMVMTAIMTWLIQRVVMAAVKKIISMFNPVSGIISILMSLWNVIRFVIEKARQIMMLAAAVFGTLAPLIKGDVKKAADQVERALAIVLPLALGFLAGLLGLGKLAGYIVNLMKKFGAYVLKIVKKVINIIVKMFKRLFGKGDRGKDLKDPKLEKQRQHKAMRDVISSVDKLEGPRRRFFGKERKAVTREQVTRLLEKKKRRHGFKKLSLITTRGEHKIQIEAGFSPSNNLTTNKTSLGGGGQAPTLSIGDPVSYKTGKIWAKGLVSEPPGTQIEVSSWTQDASEEVFTYSDYPHRWRLPQTSDEKQWAAGWKAIYSVGRDKWTEYNDARKVLNFRFHKFKNNWGGKHWNWHHIHEHCNGGENSVDNLGFIAKFWNDRLNHHFRRPWPRRGTLSSTGSLTLREYLAMKPKDSSLHRAWGLELLDFLALNPSVA